MVTFMVFPLNIKIRFDRKKLLFIKLCYSLTDTFSHIIVKILPIYFLVLHILEISYNKPIIEGQSHLHLHNVTQVALNYTGDIKNRQLALIDVNKDLFLVAIRTVGFGRICKIGM